MEPAIWMTPLAVAAIGALGVLAYSWHRPWADRAEAQNKFIDQVQEERDKAVARAEKAEARAEAGENLQRQERMRHDTKERETQGRLDALLRENGSLAHQLDEAIAWGWALKTGVEDGSVPPIIPAPLALRSLLFAMPTTTVRYADTGVPGVEVNPPEPPDDGQDHNLQE